MEKRFESALKDQGVDCHLIQSLPRLRVGGHQHIPDDLQPTSPDMVLVDNCLYEFFVNTDRVGDVWEDDGQEV